MHRALLLATRYSLLATAMLGIAHAQSGIKDLQMAGTANRLNANATLTLKATSQMIAESGAVVDLSLATVTLPAAFALDAEVAAAVAAHTGDATDAHAASAITNTPAGTLAATTVQAALNELDTEKAPLASPALTGTPTAPTAAADTSTTQLATTAFAKAEADAAQAAAESTAASALSAHTGNTSNPHAVTKAQVGLGNADNTSDAAKPISTATQAALDLKAPLASPTFTGTPAAPTPAAGTNTTQLATTAFVRDAVDTATQALDIKGNVRAISTTNLTLSGEQTVDGVALVAGDRILVAGQTTGSQNGIYVVAAGAWTRAADADTSVDVTSGMYAFVSEGTANGSNGYVLTTPEPIVLGTTALTYTQFSGAGQIIPGTGIAKSGNTISTFNIPNASLANSAISIAGTSVALGGSITLDTITGLSSAGLVKRTGSNALAIAAAATDYVAPSAYASANGLTMATARLLGRTTASTGAAEEVSVGASLSLASGTLQLPDTITAASVGSSTAIPVLTFDAKGRLTAASTAAVIAPAGTVSGTTLNSTVVTSSLTTVGALNAGSITSGFGSIDIGSDTLTAGATSVTTLTASGTITSADADNTIQAKFAGSTAKLRIIGYQDATVGTFLQAINAAENSMSVPLTLGGLSVRLVSGSTLIAKASSDGFELSDTYTLSWGGTYGGNYPSIAGSAVADVIQFYPQGAAGGAVLSISQSGTVQRTTIGNGGTGTTYAELILNGASGSNGGGGAAFYKNSVAKAYIGLDSYVNGGTGDQLALYASAGIKLQQDTAITGTISTTAGVAWNFGAANAVSPTSPNRTLTVTVAGTTYYVHAKTTND